MESSPDASRSSRVLEARMRVAACVPCQKQKVKCAIENGKPPCRRCKNRGVTCVFRKPLISHTTTSISELSPSQDVTRDLMMLHSAINDLRAKNSQPLLGPLHSVPPSAQPGHTSEGTTVPQYQDEPSSALSSEPEHPDVDAEMLIERSRRPSYTGSLSQAPITDLYQITRLRSLRSQRLIASSQAGNASSKSPNDIISRGVLDRSDADRLIRAYLKRPDHYLYGIVSKFQDLESIRRASSLLLVAICAVSASQESSGSTVYRICHAELRRLVSNFVFTPHVDLEDFRGLCVACFWLSDISWSISGLAIRRAVEFSLHKSFQVVVEYHQKNDHTSASESGILNEAIERLRIWYLFYICDQHLSILYGRLPVIQDQDSIRDWEMYLAAVPDSIPDRRISSQVALLRILNAVSKLFGVDVDRRVPTVFKPQLDNFNDQLDQWVASWLGRYERHPRIGDYPRKAVTLHFHFAKLFVCSHVFRGLSSDVTIDPIPPPFLNTAYMAVESAKSIIRFVVEDPDLISSFAGVPHYFHTMIAFGCSFLLKTATKYRQHITIDQEKVFSMIGQVVDLCKNTQCAQFHLVRWIGEGLQVLLSSCIGAMQVSESERRPPSMPQVETNEPFLLTPDTMGRTVEAEGAIDTTEHAGSSWDAAFQAAMLYSSDNCLFDLDYPESESRGIYSDYGPATGDGVSMEWDASMTHTNLDHFGLGLGIL